ncbi:Pex19 protein [Lipomyces arxii]|uniref:Pex19 protein n=1 Tax=Lipomyces arxii TaxID=56418 RepID=UPI0034D00689
MSKQDTPSDPVNDDDNLDDLDDYLAQFTLQDPPRPPPSLAAQPSTSKSATETLVTGDEDDFAKQLELGIEQILGELEQDPESRKQFEDMMAGINEFGPTKLTSPPPPEPVEEKKDTLQETILRTMERMKESDHQVDREVNATSEEDDFLAAMLKQLGESSGGDGSLGSDEDLTRMLAGMMDQLTSKDILYEPMKELDDKYANWLQSNKHTLPQDEADRYESQRVVVREIVVRFERPGYSDTDEDDRKYIVDRMQKMQESGSPPADIMSDMGPAGLGLGEGSIPGADNCAMQ